VLEGGDAAKGMSIEIAGRRTFFREYVNRHEFIFDAFFSE